MSQNNSNPMEYLVSFAVCFAAGMLSVQLLRWTASRPRKLPSPPMPRSLDDKEPKS